MSTRPTDVITLRPVTTILGPGLTPDEYADQLRERGFWTADEYSAWLRARERRNRNWLVPRFLERELHGVEHEANVVDLDERRKRRQKA